MSMNTALSAIVAMWIIALPSAHAADCTQTYVDGLVPLADLGPGLYKGYQGGLYPAGSNERPASHTVAGITMAAQVQPLNGAGQADPNGKIVLISVGMSNTRNEWDAFMPVAMADPDLNPKLALVQCALGSNDVQDWLTSTAAWSNCASQLAGHGLTSSQVQAVWMYHHLREERFPDLAFPADAHYLRDRFKELVIQLKATYPNLQVLYVSGREYGGYGTKHPEPYAYENTFAQKFLVEDQINRDPALRFDGAAPPSPWLSWAIDLWANGLGPDRQVGGIPGRSDGLEWECGDFNPDGIHPSSQGAAKVAPKLLTFFKSDVTTCSWFTKPGHACPAGGGGGSTTPTVATPRLIPAGGAFAAPVSVTLQTETTGSTIFYTTNGSTPTTSSAVYLGPFTLSASATVKAIASQAGYNDSATASATFTIYTAPPSGDGTPPAPITNLTAGSPTTASILLSWSAPGDDGLIGTASVYDVRYSTTAMTDSTWAMATPLVGEPAPAASGTAQSFSVTSLAPDTTYFLAITSSDEAGNVSARSNVVSAKTRRLPRSHRSR